MKERWLDTRMRLGTTTHQKELEHRWRRHIRDWTHCNRCGLGKLACMKCFGRGELPADIVFIGEGPGKSEDAIGAPFVGMAGRYFSEWLAEAKKLYPGMRMALTNILICRPRDARGLNRAPTHNEALQCSRRLREFLRMADPKAICLLGQVPAQYSNLQRECFLDLPVLRIKHPAYHCRTGRYSKAALQDKQKLLAFLASIPGAERTGDED